jgi:isoquinoline 1-oxidoreductase subunit beta
MMLSFSWLASCVSDPKQVVNLPEEWFQLNGFLKIGDNGLITIMSPNPEIGQNVKTSMPMIVAEELDCNWGDVLVEQAPLNTDIFTRQLAGGSQSIRQGWDGLRMAGATARAMLTRAAAEKWKVSEKEITTSAGKLFHKASNKEAGFGEMASLAATMNVPEEVPLKEIKDYKIIGTPRKNVDAKKIVTGKPLYGLDVQKEGMLIAMIVHPPAFGLKLKSIDNQSEAEAMPGIKKVFTLDSYPDGFERTWADANAFSQLAVVVGESTWQVMKAKKALKVSWEPAGKVTHHYARGDNSWEKSFPAGSENSRQHQQKMSKLAGKNATVARKDGNPETAFANAARVIERTYTAPFLAHNTMEPINFFADVTADKAVLIGPVQTPEYMEKSVAKRIGLPLDKVDVQMTRQGGGFGRRLYGHFMVEAAAVSKQMKAPVKLIYTREDDMTNGTYRPAYHATYRAALDENNNLVGFHVNAGGIPESPLFANRFPAGAVENYLAESWEAESNITVGAWRAPRSNFIAGAEQSFLDEIAEAAGKDPIAFRLELLNRAKNNPVGKDNDYDAARYAGVLELVREKSGWNKMKPGSGKGVAAYFCHNSYVAQVMELKPGKGKPKIEKVHCAVDCGIVVNPLAATNLVEGGTVDGIGHAMFGALTFEEGAAQQQNFDKYRLIRQSEAPKSIDVHFVKNEIHPTGLGEPMLPPIIGALANAYYDSTGERLYDQPFFNSNITLG